jgi:quercetin 2,3-dioxygenase
VRVLVYLYSLDETVTAQSCNTMSRRAEDVSAEACVALGAADRTLESYPNRELSLGSLAISRALPVKDKRLVGPWCFLDRFGPLSFTDGKPMDVAPHPHIGLQTVTWLFDGEVVHDDSLGSEAMLRPGGVNVMTSGGGIAHAEQTPRDHTGRLNGVQLWVALPDQHRQRPAAFEHLRDVPQIESRGGLVRVFAGAIGDIRSPASHYSEIVGADLKLHAGHTLDVPLDPTFEHAVLVTEGDCSLDGQPLEERALHYLGTKRSEACFVSARGGRALLIGGPPFPETILMWWNFVARTPAEIADARADWEAHRRFGDVPAYNGPRLSAPSLMRLARPNPVS